MKYALISSIAKKDKMSFMKTAINQTVCRAVSKAGCFISQENVV